MISPMDTVAVHAHEMFLSFRRAGFGRVASLVMAVQALPVILSEAVPAEVWETVEVIDADDVPPEWDDGEPA